VETSVDIDGPSYCPPVSLLLVWEEGHRSTLTRRIQTYLGTWLARACGFPMVHHILVLYVCMARPLRTTV
jgi:hypothetical protein